MELFTLLDWIGTFVFAVSGALSAMNKRFDIFGVFIIAFVTALGGGTLRDVLIDRRPLVWMADMNYTYIVLAAVLFTVLFRTKISFLRRTFFLFDSIGIGLFTVIGVEIGLKQGLHAEIAVALGVMSAVFGGVIRDILTKEVPIIFHKEIYATPCLLGGIVFVFVYDLDIPKDWMYAMIIFGIVLFRILATRYQWTLPLFYKQT